MFLNVCLDCFHQSELYHYYKKQTENRLTENAYGIKFYYFSKVTIVSLGAFHYKKLKTGSLASVSECFLEALQEIERSLENYSQTTFDTYVINYQLLPKKGLISQSSILNCILKTLPLPLHLDMHSDLQLSAVSCWMS